MASVEATGSGQTPDDDLIRAIPTRHPWRWVAVAVLVYLFVALVHWMWTNPNFHWDVFRQYLFGPAIVRGLGWTLVITVISMVIGILIGILLAVMRQSPSPIVVGGAWLYTWFFRGTPVYVQVLLWGSIGALTGPKPPVGVPLTNVVFFHVDANNLITPFTAAILALGLNEGAYMSEIVRAGFLAVDEGQTEAAKSLGMSRRQTITRIVLPQAMRVIVPPTGNETISMLKTTSIVSVIAFGELLYNAQLIYAVNYQVIALLLVTCFWYLLATSVLSVGQFYVERYFGRGSSRTVRETPFQRFRAIWSRNVAARHAKPPDEPLELPSGEGR